LDVLTARVLDLSTGVGIAEISHDSKIDWLELNGRGNLLLFRDKRRQLHLYNIHKQERTTLLSYCNYVQWVPDSDVVVAQVSLLMALVSCWRRMWTFGRLDVWTFGRLDVWTFGRLDV
jgi:intraflagellar transport protein 172